VLVVVSAHLLSQSRLVHHQLFQTVREEAAFSVHAEPSLRKTSAELQLTLATNSKQGILVQHRHAHYQNSIILDSLHSLSPLQTSSCARSSPASALIKTVFISILA
jgi:hypothetical protein